MQGYPNFSFTEVEQRYEKRKRIKRDFLIGMLGVLIAVLILSPYYVIVELLASRCH
jgi:hypothetical protein